MFELILVIAPLFIIIFGSAFLVKFGIADVKWQEELNAYALKIGFPALLFSALAGMEFSIMEEWDLLLANSIFLLMSFVLAYVIGKLLKLKKKMFMTLFICLGFGNAAYLGIPALVQSYGDSVLGEASLVVAVYLLFIFTIGIGCLEIWNKKNKDAVLHKILFRLVKNPLLLAVVFGLVFSYLNLELPSALQQAIDMLAASVTPIVLVVIGLFLGHTKFGKLKDWLPSGIFTLMTLMVLPAIFYFVVKAMQLDTGDFSVSIVDAAMPLAITPFALVEEYNLDKSFIARSIVLSTILSVLTIPFWIFVV
ncbi:AEC family transporter [Candidatus Peregrinibacteria bacterium]|jgi:predicted permease|nr:AEC family transporter [Candidatus Peregrinibacteria bacterium]MBT4632251.1 AEC family transporter [Candidatus Peregrinibacteria bacterium]MBT5516647.1 AEC family transporter [Candidatus Peregrinibacteria bacterium]MBT5824338.1 AEC family transporter [Candidatus Peregrinibacteria bacterium]